MRFYIPFIFLLFSCSTSNETGVEKDDSDSENKIATSEEAKTCCMQSLDDFKPYLPQSAGSFVSKGKVVGNLFCLDDPGMHSQGGRSYYDSDEIKYRVIIRDYCSKELSEFEHMADENYNSTLKNSEGELKVIKSDLIRGYAKYYKQNPNLNSGNPAELAAIVDDRFYLSIKAQDQHGIGQVMALYSTLPVEDLASLGK